MVVKRTSRLLKLLTTLQSESQSRFEDLLETLSVSRRTLYRDLRALQEADIPCYFDRTGQCYKVDSSFYMPPANLTAKEAFSLLLLVHKAREVLDVPFSQSALRGAIKIENVLPPKVRWHCSENLKTVSIHGKRTKAETSTDDKFELLQRAIRRRQILKLTYDTRSGQGVITCNFSPLHLIYTDFWHVMGKLNLGRQIQSINLKDIQRIERTGKCFLNEEKFDPSDHLGRAWCTAPEGRLYNVELRFVPAIARDVTAIQWHDTQDSTIEQDGSALLEFRVDGLDEIIWWIVSFGDKVEVIRPEVLRQRIHKIAANMAIKSKTADNKPPANNIISKDAASQKRAEHSISFRND